MLLTTTTPVTVCVHYRLLLYYTFTCTWCFLVELPALLLQTCDCDVMLVVVRWRCWTCCRRRVRSTRSRSSRWWSTTSAAPARTTCRATASWRCCCRNSLTPSRRWLYSEVSVASCCSEVTLSRSCCLHVSVALAARGSVYTVSHVALRPVCI